MSVIPLSSVGEGRGSSLICHATLDLGEDGGLVNWYYPSGSVITEEGEWYVSRGGGNVTLGLTRRADTQGPSGTYCCFVTIRQEAYATCALLGE